MDGHTSLVNVVKNLLKRLILYKLFNIHVKTKKKLLSKHFSFVILAYDLKEIEWFKISLE